MTTKERARVEEGLANLPDEIKQRLFVYIDELVELWGQDKPRWEIEKDCPLCKVAFRSVPIPDEYADKLYDDDEEKCWYCPVFSRTITNGSSFMCTNYTTPLTREQVYAALVELQKEKNKNVKRSNRRRVYKTKRNAGCSG